MKRRDRSIADDSPHPGLERALIEEYLCEQGYGLDDLASFGHADRKLLMEEAAAYAALRLCELSLENR